MPHQVTVPLHPTGQSYNLAEQPLADRSLLRTLPGSSGAEVPRSLAPFRGTAWPAPPQSTRCTGLPETGNEGLPQPQEGILVSPVLPSRAQHPQAEMSVINNSHQPIPIVIGHPDSTIMIALPEITHAVHTIMCVLTCPS